jgi:hypothetical protein
MQRAMQNDISQGIPKSTFETFNAVLKISVTIDITRITGA